MASVRVKYQKIELAAKVPTKATGLSACYDVYALEDTVLKSFQATFVRTGLKIQCEPGYAIFMYPRSGLATKLNVTLANSVGIIDADYGDELLVSLFNRNELSIRIAKHDRIAQLRVVRLIDIVWIEDSVKGRAGFGSTGR
jgi:dUTP pyrophosphatase